MAKGPWLGVLGVGFVIAMIGLVPSASSVCSLGNAVCADVHLTMACGPTTCKVAATGDHSGIGQGAGQLFIDGILVDTCDWDGPLSGSCGTSAAPTLWVGCHDAVAITSGTGGAIPASTPACDEGVIHCVGKWMNYILGEPGPEATCALEPPG